MGDYADALRRSMAEERDAVGRAVAEGRSRADVADSTIDSLAVSATGAGSPATPEVAVCRSKGERWAERAVLVDPGGSAAEDFRHLALRTQRALEARRARSVLVTSPGPAEGKTTVACNLALALASLAGVRSIALVDLDLHTPAVARALGVAPGVGLAAVLEGRAPLAAARTRCDVPRLDLFLSTAADRETHELLARPALEAALGELARGFDTVVIDAPPALPVADAPLIAEHADAWLAVARAGYTRRAALQEMFGLLPDQRLLGVFVNQVRRRVLGEPYASYASPQSGPRESG